MRENKTVSTSAKAGELARFEMETRDSWRRYGNGPLAAIRSFMAFATEHEESKRKEGEKEGDLEDFYSGFQGKFCFFLPNI